jgi:hypothetical protein
MKITVWEPEQEPPHPSTVSDISEAAQNLIAALERSWQRSIAKRQCYTSDFVTNLNGK